MYFPKSWTVPLIVFPHLGVPTSLLLSKLQLQQLWKLDSKSISALSILTKSLCTEHLPPECHHLNE